MNKMTIQKRCLIQLFNALILMLLLMACGRGGDTNMPSASPSQEEMQAVTQSVSPYAAPIVSPTPDPELPYKGDGSKYEYIMTDERDRAWEEDIVYFADRFLDKDSGHPKLIKRGCVTVYVNGFRNSMRDEEIRYETLYEPELRDEFIGRINRLILSIPEKSDADLCLDCSETAAIFNDVHTFVHFYHKNHTDTFYPLELMPVFNNEVPEAYIVAAPKGMEDILLCRLDAINGVPLSEIYEKLAALEGKENKYWLYNVIFLSEPAIHKSYVILCNEILRHYGIQGESETAVFTLTDEKGMTRDIKISSFLYEEGPEMVVFRPADVEDESIAVELRTSNEKESVWSAILDDGKVLYIRFNVCTENADQIVEKAIFSIQKKDTVKKVILDFRGNSGGYDIIAARIASALDSLEASDGKYILIDGGSSSSSVSIGVLLRRFCKDVLLVGAPSGMSPNGNFSRNSFEAPNGLLSGAQSASRCFYLWPGNDDPALMPDITVYQTLEDYRNGIDTVMKYLLGASVE